MAILNEIPKDVTLVAVSKTKPSRNDNGMLMILVKEILEKIRFKI